MRYFIYVFLFFNFTCIFGQKAPINYFKAYEIKDDSYGNKTKVSLKKDKRIIKTNALPNHKTGTFPRKGNPNKISAQNKTYELPLEPKFTGKAKWAREPGIAINGVKFEPETAEIFICESGEKYKIEAFQNLINLGLDLNNAHVQPTGAYHYHGVPKELIKQLDKGKDLIHVGFALDGFPIYYSKSNQYKPSYKISAVSRTGDICTYENPKRSITKNLNNTSPDGTFVSDWEYQKGLGELDECNGIEIDGEYKYFITDDYPYVGRCLKGKFTEKRHRRPPPSQHPHGMSRERMHLPPSQMR